MQRGEIEGTYTGHPKGFGFVRPSLYPSRERRHRVHDLFIPRGASGDAIDGDRVLVRPGARGTGKVLAVVERGRRKLAGTYLGEGLFRPDSHSIPKVFPLKTTPHRKGPALRPGVKVIAHREGEGYCLGVVLGPTGNRQVEDRAVLEEMEISGRFGPDALKEARRFEGWKAGSRERRGRLDLRGEPTVVTIDPVTAKDFDDAISLRRKRDGAYLLGVHIADVSHYVEPGKALDREARLRGFSAYLPTGVIPMLPPVLSDGACSLREGEDRLAISVLLTFDPHGTLQGTRVGRSVIRSDRRLTYQRASRLMEGAGGETQKISQLLKDMHRLAALLLKQRPSLAIHEAGVEFVYSPEGELVEVHTTEGDDAHWVIEEFMLAANREVAGWLLAKGEPILFRHHPPPLDLGELREFLSGMGIEGARDRPLPEVMRRATEAGLGTAATSFLLQAMESAEYSSQKPTHHALGFPHYVHFTSPIRRYADLMVHRAVARHLRPGRWVEMRSRVRAPEPGAAPVSTPELEGLASHLNRRERAIGYAERRLRRRRVLEFLSLRAGETFQGVILRALERGLLVNLPGYLISGFVDLESLGPGANLVRPHRLSAGGTIYHPGQEMPVRIRRIDPARGELDLGPASHFHGTLFPV